MNSTFRSLSLFIFFCLCSIYPALAQPGTSLSFNGTNQKVNVNTTLGNFGTGDFTLEAWVNTTSSSSPQSIITKRSACAISTFLSFAIRPNGKINLEIDGGDVPTYTFIVGNQVVTDSRWHHIAGVRKGSMLLLYVDGKLDASMAVAGSPDLTNTDLLVIGAVPCAALDFFRGKLDEVRIYNTALTPENIASDMVNTISSVPGNLQAYYNFDEGSGTALTDRTTNGNNGTLVNSPTWVESYALVVPLLTSLTSANTTDITINWSAPKFGTVDNYLVDVSANSDFTSPISGSPFTTTLTSKDITGLSANTIYYYRVRADKTTVTGQGSYSTTGVRSQSASIIGFSPSSGPPGTLLTLTGTNLDNLDYIRIGGFNTAVISNTGSTVVAMVMPAAVSGAVTVSAAGSVLTAGSNFTVTSGVPTGYVQQAKIAGTGGVGVPLLGVTMKISADGNTAIAAGRDDNGGAGAAWVFTRSGSTWTQQGPKLVGNGSVGNANQGSSVGISADGNTIIIGGPADNSNQGAAWIFTRSGTTWTQQGPKLLGTGDSTDGYQGSAVALSADGKVAIIGGISDNSTMGASWIFTRSTAPGGNGSVWVQQGTKLLANDNTGNARLGTSVALSADGSTAIVGGYLDNNFKGAAWIYTRNGNTWTQQGSKLLGSGSVGQSLQGGTVALSADGNTAIVSGSGDDNPKGAAWVYTRSGTTWTQQGSKLLANDNVGGAHQGTAVSLSADGNIAIVGGASDDGNKGANWIYTRSGGVWSQLGNKAVGTGAVGNASQGEAIGLSADGSTFISGGWGDSSNAGAVWAFKAVSHDATLSAMTISAGTLTPSFAVETTTYTAAVPNTTSSITLTPTATDETAVIKVNTVVVTSGTASGNINLNVGANTITVEVTAGDGTTVKTYTITVTRAASTDATLSAIVPSAGTLTPAFVSGTLSYAVAVPNNTSSITITPTRSESTASIKVNAVAVTSGTASGAINMNVGANTITVEVTAGDGTTIKTYTITVTRAASDDATLSAIAPSAGALTPAFASGTLSYAVAVPNNTSSITITPTRSENTATIKVNTVAVASGAASGNINLNVGANTITVEVTAGDGTTIKTYTITVTRAASDDATLSAIAPSAGALTPAFASGTVSYAVTVPNSTTSITITPTRSESTASIKVNAVAVTSGAASGAISLNVGANTITVEVTAGDGATTKTYTINVTRAASANANLSSLTTTGGTFNPVFSSSATAYALSVAASTASLTITPTVDQPDAIVKVEGVTVASGASSANIPLVTGINTVTVTITAQDGTTTKNYILTVTKAAAVSTVANLAGLTLNTGTLSTTFNSGTTSYTATVPYVNNSIALTPTTEQGNATVKVNGVTVPSGSASSAIALNVGANVIQTVVTAQDGVTAKTYTVTVTRNPASTIANLSGLSTNGGTLTPSFAAQTTAYTLFVPNSTTALTITPTTDNAYATVKVNGISVRSQNPSGNLDLALGLNTITTIVTAEDGISTKTYTLKVNRLAADQILTDQSGGVTVNNIQKEVVVTSPTQPIIVNIPAGTTTTPTVDYGNIVSGGTGTVPQTTINSPLAKIEIPAATTITGSTTTWAGALSAPKISDYDFPRIKGQTITKGLVIEVGDPNVSLTFTKAVRLVLYGQAGMRIARVHGGIFTEITAVGNSDTQAEGDALAADASFKLNAGADLIVWTKGFSQFITFSQGVNLDEAIAAADLADLTAAKILGSNPSVGEITSPLTLPSAGPGGSAITWTSDAVGIISNDGKAVVRPTFGSGSATVNLTATITKGTAIETRSFTLTVIQAPNQAPTLSPIANQIICYTPTPQTVALNGITAGPESAQTTTVTASSNNAGLLSQLSVANGVLTYVPALGAAGVATITVTVKDNGGTANGGADTFSRSFTVTINALPVAAITSDLGNEISLGSVVSLNATGGTSYSWATNAGIISGQNTATLIVKPLATTRYTVTVTNVSGCTSTQSITLTVLADYKTINAYNILSPNGDGKNDKFIIRNIDLYPGNTLKIFDRTGRIIYQKTNYTNDWDGTLAGVPLAEDTYFYTVDFGASKGVFKGFVSIVR